MQLIRGIHNLPVCRPHFSEGCVLTIGNFDGIHLGHRQVLEQVKSQSNALNLPSVVMFFEPLPVEFFKAKCTSETPPVRLMNVREKLAEFKHEVIDWVLLCRFNEAFSVMTASDFVQTILVDALRVKHIIVGDDFCFGKGREGNFDFLKAQGALFGFSVESMPTYQYQQQRISSTRVRKALSSPDLHLAETLMGHPFQFSGRVIHGKKLGRQLGFRTLNLNPKRTRMPVEGVFAVEVFGLSNEPVAGVANIGTRPTIDGLRPSIEVHLFHWNKDVYGWHVKLSLMHFIRSEMKFDGLDALKKQITQDAQQAKELLKIDDKN